MINGNIREAEIEKAVAIFRWFLSLQTASYIKKKSLSPFSRKEPSFLDFQGRYDTSFIKTERHWKWSHTAFVTALCNSSTIPFPQLLRAAFLPALFGGSAVTEPPLPAADMHLWWCFYSNAVSYKLRISLMQCLPCI